MYALGFGNATEFCEGNNNPCNGEIPLDLLVAEIFFALHCS